MYDSVCDQFAFMTELHPLDCGRPALGADLTRWNHDVLAPDASYSHQFPLRNVLVKFLDGRVR
jgi:hypothetical protein